MRYKTISSIGEFIARVLKKHLNSPFQQTLYRLLEIKYSPAGHYKLVIQVIGKTLIREYKPQEIVDNERLLEGFSKKDVCFITYLACEQNRIPRYKIVMQEFCQKFNRMLFRLKKRDSDELISKTASQISLDKHLINNLSQEDVCSISYMAGYEQSYWEREKDK